MKINILDGGIIFELNKEYSDYGEYAVMHNPMLVKKLYQSYINIGSSYLTTSNYGFTPLKIDNWKEATIQSLNLIQEFRSSHVKVCGCIPPFFKSYSTEPVTEDFKLFYHQLVSLMIGQIDYFLIETVASLEHVQTIIKIIRELNCDIPIMVSLYINEDNQQNIGSFFKLPIERLMVNCCSFSKLTTFYHQYLKQQSWGEINFGFYCNKINEQAYAIDCQVSNLQKFKNQQHISTKSLQSFLLGLPFENILIGGCCGYGVEEMRELSHIIKSIQGL